MKNLLNHSKDKISNSYYGKAMSKMQQNNCAYFLLLAVEGEMLQEM